MKNLIKLSSAFVITVLVDSFIRRIVPSHPGLIFSDPISLGVAAVAISAASAGYGIYAGERAQKAQQNAINQARDQAAQQQQQQAQQLAQQKIDSAKLLSDQQATQTQNMADTKAAQTAAISQEQAAIPGIQDSINQSLIAQNKTAQDTYQPVLENRLNQLGLLQSGSVDAQSNLYQEQLDSQRQAALAQFSTNANQQVQTNQYGNSVADVQLGQANMNTNLQTAANNLSQQWATQGVDNANNAAYNQYISGLQSDQAGQQQQNANAYLNLGGQIAGGALNYYGDQNSTNPALQSLYDYRNGGKQYAPGSYSYPTQNLIG